METLGIPGEGRAEVLGLRAGSGLWAFKSRTVGFGSSWCASRALP